MLFLKNKKQEETAVAVSALESCENYEAEVRKAEARAYELVGNNVEFEQGHFNEFKNALRLVSNQEVRSNLILLLLKKLDFHGRAHNKTGKKGFRTETLEDEFVERVQRNASADICSKKLDDFENLDKLICYLQSTLNSVFVDLQRKLGRIISVDGQEKLASLPDRCDELLYEALNKSRESTKNFVRSYVAKFEKTREWHRGDLLYAHAVEGKKFTEIAQEFNDRYKENVTADSYRYRYNDTIARLKLSNQLKDLYDDIVELRARLNSSYVGFGVESTGFKLPQDSLQE